MEILKPLTSLEDFKLKYSVKKTCKIYKEDGPIEFIIKPYSGILEGFELYYSDLGCFIIFNLFIDWGSLFDDDPDEGTFNDVTNHCIQIMKREIQYLDAIQNVITLLQNKGLIVGLEMDDYPREGDSLLRIEVDWVSFRDYYGLNKISLPEN